MDFFETSCDELDAAVFTGDALTSEENRIVFREYLARWGRELESMEDPQGLISKLGAYLRRFGPLKM